MGQLYLVGVFGDGFDGTESDLPALLDQLAQADDEHFDVSASLPNGWSIGVSAGGHCYLEHLEDDAIRPRSAGPLPREELLHRMQLLARGDLGALEALSWRPGYR